MRSLVDFIPGAEYETPRRTLTEAHRVLFAGLTGDGCAPVPAHERLAGRSEDAIIPGTLLFSLAIGLTFESGIYEDSILAYLGIDRLDQTAPCYVGDTVAIRATVLGARATSDGERGVVRMRYDLAAVNRDRELMSADLALLVRAVADDTVDAT